MHLLSWKFDYYYIAKDDFIERVNFNDTNNENISEEDIKRAMSKIDSSNACGPDGIPNVLLNKCIDSLARPIQLLWTKSLEVSIIPELLKKQIILPTLKPGLPRADPASWRPLSMTSGNCRVCSVVHCGGGVGLFWLP